MLWYCCNCTTAYAVGLEACPHCGSTEYQEEPVSKITVHGGFTDATFDDVPEDAVEVPEVEPEASYDVPEGDDKGDDAGDDTEPAKSPRSGKRSR